MYCGKNKVAIASQHQIAEALMHLIEEKPYQEITISELCKTAGISRQTFYSLFTSRDNVVIYTLQENYCYDPQEPPASCSELRHLCQGYGEYISRNRAFLRMLVDNHIEHLLYDSIAGSLESCSCFLPGRPSTRRQFAADYLAGGITGVVKRYALSGCETTQDDLEELLYDLLSGRFFC